MKLNLPLKKAKNLYFPNQSGQILISILVAIAVFAILIHAVFTLIASSYDLVNYNRARITARHMAQEKMEIIRNLPYSDVGTEGGIPEGVLKQEENMKRNGLNYKVKTSIIFIDDPFNGLSASDTDYKRVRVEVSWEGLAASRKNPVVFITDISSQQAGASEGGTLKILVFNANGQPVNQASVKIVASAIAPPVDVTYLTNPQGEVNLPGATPCNECYQITVTKAGYSTERTYAVSEVTNPLKPHASLLIGQTTQISFTIDEVGTINISSVDSRASGFSPLGNVQFRLRGNKLIGVDASAQLVYKYDEILTTNSSGNISLSNMEWDVYQISMPSPTSYDIAGTTPLLPLNLLPKGTISSTFALESHTTHSLLVIIKDPSQNLIASASARLYNGGFDQTQATGRQEDPDFGQTLFSGLTESTYQIQATASGYLDHNGNLDISGYKITEIVLSP